MDQGLASLIGVAVGGLVTFFVQQSSFKKQQDLELKKIELQFSQEQILKKLEIYNKILRAAGETEIVNWDMYNGERSFNTEPYEEKIKPLLYESFHLLDQEIANSVNNIDGMIAKWNFKEEADEGDEEEVSDNYSLIINNIQKHLENYRRKYISSME